jgi:hypothetical protein
VQEPGPRLGQGAGGRHLAEGGHYRGQVQAVGEVAAVAGEHHRSYVRIGVQRTEHQRQFPPEVRAHGVTPARAEQSHLLGRLPHRVSTCGNCRPSIPATVCNWVRTVTASGCAKTMRIATATISAEP